MKAKLVLESIDDIFKPKTQEDVVKSVDSKNEFIQVLNKALENNDEDFIFKLISNENLHKKQWKIGIYTILKNPRISDLIKSMLLDQPFIRHEFFKAYIDGYIDEKEYKNLSNKYMSKFLDHFYFKKGIVPEYLKDTYKDIKDWRKQQREEMKRWKS